MCHIITFKEGETIFKEGERDDSLYIIMEGKVKIIKERGKSHIVLAELGKGDFFGEMEIIHPSKTGRTAGAVAVTDVKLIRITKKDIDTAIKESQIYAFKLIHFFAKVLCERLRIMDEAYTKLFLDQKGEARIDELKSFKEKLIKEWGF